MLPSLLILSYFFILAYFRSICEFYIIYNINLSCQTFVEFRIEFNMLTKYSFNILSLCFKSVFYCVALHNNNNVNSLN